MLVCSVIHTNRNKKSLWQLRYVHRTWIGASQLSDRIINIFRWMFKSKNRSVLQCKGSVNTADVSIVALHRSFNRLSLPFNFSLDFRVYYLQQLRVWSCCTSMHTKYDQQHRPHAHHSHLSPKSLQPHQYLPSSHQESQKPPHFCLHLTAVFQSGEEAAGETELQQSCRFWWRHPGS